MAGQVNHQYAEQLKLAVKVHPIISGGQAPVMFAAGPGAFPTGVAHLLVEIVERLDALEERR